MNTFHFIVQRLRIYGPYFLLSLVSLDFSLVQLERRYYVGKAPLLCEENFQDMEGSPRFPFWDSLEGEKHGCV